MMANEDQREWQVFHEDEDKSGVSWDLQSMTEDALRETLYLS